MFALKAALLFGLGLALPVFAEEMSAKDIMMKACDAYKGADSVKLRALVSVDEFAESDLKLQKNSVVDVMIKRDNKFKAISQGDEQSAVYFNGAMLTAVDNKTGFFAQEQLKGNLKDFLEVTEKFNQPVTLLDFYAGDYCKANLARAGEGEKIGTLMLDGNQVEHLAFVNAKDAIHWEAWVRKDGDRYLVKKVVITSTDIKSQPQAEILLVKEEINPKIDDQEFEFVTGAKNIAVKFLEHLKKSDESDSWRYYGGYRRVARRTARRVGRRASYAYYNRLPYYYYSTGPLAAKKCTFDGQIFNCEGQMFRPVIEGGVTVYVREK